MQAVLNASPRRKSLTTSDSFVPGTASLDNDGAIYLLPFATNCGNTFSPVISVANTGSNEITSAIISYQVDNNPAVTYNWTGSLNTATDARIELPQLSVFAEGEHTFSATLVSVNGNMALVNNNTRTNEFYYEPIDENSIYDTETIKITVQPDLKGSEIQWFFMDSNQEILAYGFGYPDSEDGELPAADVQTITVDNNACYAFVIIDMAENGICCTNGNGFFRVETSDGTVITEGSDYGFYSEALIGINVVLGNKNFEKGNGIVLYPNPANNILNIATANSADMPENYTVYNSLGQMMGSGAVTSELQALDIAKYAQGVYFVKLVKGSETKTLQFIKN